MTQQLPQPEPQTKMAIPPSIGEVITSMLTGNSYTEWVTTYYEEVSKIPSYFSIEDWKESEKLIYSSMVNEINGHFAARGTFDSGMRPKLLETFKAERERVINKKEKVLGTF